MATAPVLPESQRANVSAIARRFGVPDREISIAPRQGQVNLTIFLGSELVLRLPRQQKFEERLAKEAEVIPFVLDRGIPTAKLLSFDSGHATADFTYMVLERLHGRAIDEMPPLEEGQNRTYGSLFEILASLHSLRKDSEMPIRGVQAAEFSYEELLNDLTSAGEIGSSQAAWLGRWFRRLEAQGARTSDSVLLHGDVMPSNLILNSTGEVTAIIDWGSACWGEPMRDLAGFHTSILPGILPVYQDVAGSHPANAGTSAALEASVLWYQLFFALAKLLGRQSTSEKRNWSAPREARLLEMMRFFSSDVPDLWRTLFQMD